MKYILKTIHFVGFFSCCLSSHAISLGRVTVNDPIMGNREIVYEKINNYAVVEGDILLSKLSDLKRKDAVIAVRLGGSRWPHALVAYEIDEDLPFQNKLSVLQAIDHWKKNSKINFIELTSKNRTLYQDYVSFVPAPGTICASYVGRKGGKQIIELSKRCTMMNTVHEIGHSLGLWHEQSRSDRDSFVRIVWENILEDHKHNFNQHLTDGRDYGEYDYQSIMHYGAYTFSKNGFPTIIPLIDGVEIGQRNHLSSKDITAIDALYSEE